nr:ribonuclease H-like domain-containing protein [Tanacetum cinerariifolium]
MGCVGIAKVELAIYGGRALWVIYRFCKIGPYGFTAIKFYGFGILIGSGRFVLVQPSPEWSSGSLLVSPAPSIVPSPISSHMISLTIPSSEASPVTAEAGGFLAELGPQVEMQGGLICDHTVRLGELSPDLFERYDRDIRELFTRSGAFRDEIFFQRYRFRSLEHEQERTIITFRALWRPVLALEAWAGCAALQRELQEMRGRVTAVEHERDRREWLWKIVSQLAILGENISQEDLNLKFLRSLPSEWNTHVVVLRNKPNLDTISFNDLYNNFKIVKHEAKGTTSSCSSSSSQNMAFVSSPSSTNKVNTAYGVSTANTQVSTASTQSYMADDEGPTNMAFIAFSDSEGVGFVSYNDIPPPPIGLFSPPKLDLSNSGLEGFQQPEFEGYGPKTSNHVSEDMSNEVKESPDAPLVKELVKPVMYAEMYKSQCPRGNQRNCKNQKSQQLRSDFVIYNKACFVCGSFNHVQANCNYYQRERVGNPQLDLQERGVIDIGFSIHMTKNMSYLYEYEEIDGRYVAFGGDPKGGKITSKGKINTGKLDFKDVYFIKELKFNLFSVSQMCDKKNNVLFTNTECVVLSLDFKLLDKSQVLLRVPRKNNMYSVDLNNVASLGSLSCLFAKAILDESNLWHRRLGHIKFKTMNKLVRGNLIRGKFDGKADEGFFVGYSVNSKAFRLFDINTLIKSMNYKPVVVGNQSNGSIVPRILLKGEEKKDAKDPRNKDNEVPSTEEPKINQETDTNVNNTNNINVVSLTINATDIKDNAVNKDIVFGCAEDLNMPNLEVIVYSDEDKEVGAEADMTNLDTNITLEYDFKECYKDLSEKLDWENTEGGDYPFDLTKPLPLIMNGNHQIVPVDYFFDNNLKYLQGGISTMTYMNSIMKTKATQYDLPGIEDMVPNIQSHVKVAYDKHEI